MAKGLKVGKYWFSPNVPEEVIASCKDTLVDNEFLIPTWCNEVRIFWDAQGDDSEHGLGTVAAYVDTSYAYRYASIFICPPFLNEEPEDRALRIKHELCHIVSSPLISYIRDVAKILGTDETIEQMVVRESSEKIESMTEDLAQIITKMEQHYATKKLKK